MKSWGGRDVKDEDDTLAIIHYTSTSLLYPVTVLLRYPIHMFLRSYPVRCSSSSSNIVDTGIQTLAERSTPKQNAMFGWHITHGTRVSRKPRLFASLHQSSSPWTRSQPIFRLCIPVLAALLRRRQCPVLQYFIHHIYTRSSFSPTSPPSRSSYTQVVTSILVFRLGEQDRCWLKVHGYVQHGLGWAPHHTSGIGHPGRSRSTPGPFRTA